MNSNTAKIKTQYSKIQLIFFYHPHLAFIKNTQTTMQTTAYKCREVKLINEYVAWKKVNCFKKKQIQNKPTKCKRFPSPSHLLKWEKVITVLQCLILLAFILFIFHSKLLFWLSKPSLNSLSEASAPVIYLCFAFIAQKSTDFFKVHLKSDSDFSFLSATLITHSTQLVSVLSLFLSQNSQQLELLLFHLCCLIYPDFPQPMKHWNMFYF